MANTGASSYLKALYWGTKEAFLYSLIQSLIDSNTEPISLVVGGSNPTVRRTAVPKGLYVPTHSCWTIVDMYLHILLFQFNFGF